MIKKILLTICLMAGLVSLSHAATFRTGEDVVISGRTVINSNLVVTGKKIHIYGVVRGDVLAAGEEIVIEGRVYGDIIAAGRVIRIQAHRVEDVRVAGQEIFISTRTDRDVFAAGQYVTLSNTNSTDADVVVMGQNIKVGGFVGGNLKARGERITQDSDLVVRKGKEISEGQNRIHISRKLIALGLALAAGFKIYTILILWGILCLFLLWMPKQLRAIQVTMDTHILKSVGVAFIFLILLPFLWLAFGISIVGIPLIFLSIAWLIFLGFIYKINLALWLGEKIFSLPFINTKSRGRKKTKITARSPHVLFWVGMVLLFILQHIPVLGGLFMFFSYFWVLGAMLLSKQVLHRTLLKKKII
jgi:cytoskeletal protein CcmA (bactofilin family)